MFRVLTDHGYVLCPNWPRVCSVCRNHNPVLSSFMTYHQVCNKSNATDVICGAGTVYPFGVPEVTPVFRGVRVARSLVFFLRFCRLLFFLLAIVLSVFLRFTSSGYSFDISKCFLWWEGYKWLLVFISRRYAFSMSEHIDITYIVLENGHREEIVEIRKSVYLC
jgi:hypothetical protein